MESLTILSLSPRPGLGLKNIISPVAYDVFYFQWGICTPQNQRVNYPPLTHLNFMTETTSPDWDATFNLSNKMMLTTINSTHSLLEQTMTAWLELNISKAKQMPSQWDRINYLTVQLDSIPRAVADELKLALLHREGIFADL
jgi:hypothetical protein